MPTRFESLVQLCVAEAEGLIAFAHRLTEADMGAQSACGAWKVGDVMVHLGSSAGVFARLINSMATGASAGEAEWRIPNPDRQTEVAGIAQEARRRMGDREVRRQFVENHREFIQVLHALTEEDAGKTTPAVAGGRTVYQVLGARIGEMAIHRWDMESHLRADAHLSKNALPTLMGYLAGWRTFTFQKGPRLPSPVHYRWEITGDETARWDLAVSGDSFQHLRSFDGTPEVVLTTDAETYVLAGVGRRDLLADVRSGRIKTKGSRELIEAYPRYFREL